MIWLVDFEEIKHPVNLQNQYILHPFGLSFSFLIQLKLFLIINWHNKQSKWYMWSLTWQMILYTCTTRPQSSAYHVSFLAKISLVQMIWWSQLQHQLVTCMKFWTDQCTRNTGVHYVLKCRPVPWRRLPVAHFLMLLLHCWAELVC